LRSLKFEVCVDSNVFVSRVTTKTDVNIAPQNGFIEPLLIFTTIALLKKSIFLTILRGWAKLP